MRRRPEDGEQKMSVRLAFAAMQYYLEVTEAFILLPSASRDPGHLLPTHGSFYEACRTSSRGRLFSFAVMVAVILLDVRALARGAAGDMRTERPNGLWPPLRA